MGEGSLPGQMVGGVAAGLLCGKAREGGGGREENGDSGWAEVGFLEWLRMLPQSWFADQKESGLQTNGVGVADKQCLDMSCLRM